MGMLPGVAGAPSHPPGSCGTQAGGSGIHPAELGSGSSGLGGRRAGLPAEGCSARVSRGWVCSPGGAGGYPDCSCWRRAGWLRRMRRSSQRQLGTETAVKDKGQRHGAMSDPAFLALRISTNHPLARITQFPKLSHYKHFQGVRRRAASVCPFVRNHVLSALGALVSIFNTTPS